MTRIERIQPSLHKKDRVLVYLTGGRLLRITPEELLRFDLRPGMDLAEDVLEELNRAAARSLTRQQAAEMADDIRKVPEPQNGSYSWESG